MKFEHVIPSIGTVTDLKRIASAYIIDYRNLTEDEIRAALIKTAPQYHYLENVRKTFRECEVNPDRNIRTLTPLFLARVLLNKDDFMGARRQIEDEIIAWEQDAIDRSNEFVPKKGTEKHRKLDLFRFVLETAWEGGDVSPDEKNLIVRLKRRLKLTDIEYRMTEAQLGRFPKPNNEPHTRSEIDDVRRHLHSKGLVFSIRDEYGTDYDVIPEEVAETLRRLLGVEIKRYGYRQLLRHKHVRSKAYLTEALAKSGVEVEGLLSLDDLIDLCLEQARPSVVLGGVSPKDGLPIETLTKWCGELSVNVSGSKADRIQRIIAFYDGLADRDESPDDPRALWYAHYTKYAGRDLSFLRSQQLIEKDNEVERCFEEATRFLFEKRLAHKPLALRGTAHPDGALSYRESLIYWDNKSKESPVHLKDHIKQFTAYIQSAEKTIAGFLVIAPDFTPESNPLCMRFKVEQGTTITLITAGELKDLAEEWYRKNEHFSAGSFPLGYLIQPGRFDRSLVPV